MRLVLVAMLLIYHSFAPFCGGWEPYDTLVESDVYFWIGKSSYSFFLEGFVFISGLLVGFQSKKTPLRNYNYLFLWKKFKRLFIPSIVFSVVYFVCFHDWNGFQSFVISIIQGCGHMWFLPMLFWCFVGIWILSKVNLNPYIVLVFSVVLMLLSNGILPVRIGNAMYYFVFFFLGYLVYNDHFIRQFKPTIHKIFCFSVAFIALLMYVAEYQSNNWGGVICAHLIQGMLGFSGLMACYMTISMMQHRITNIPKWLITLSQYSFGIYLIQQFVLKALYYHTSLPLKVDYLLVPWIGLVCALFISLIITSLMFKNKVGRFLLG